MALLAEPLVAIFLSEKWLPSVPVFQLVCLENLCLMIQIVNLRAYMALGASSVYLRLQLIKIAIGIVLICGVAVLTQDIYLVALVACFFGNGKTIIDLFPAKKLYGLGFFKQFSIIVPIYLIALASCIPAIAIELLGFSYLAQLGLEVITYLIVYIILSKIFRLSGYKEIIGLIKELVKG